MDRPFQPVPGDLDLIVRKIEEKLMGKEEVVFEPDEVKNCK